MIDDRRAVTRLWVWLAAPLALSSMPWATLPLVFSAGDDTEGALYIAAFAGILSTGLTAPVTIVVLAALQQRRRLSPAMYVAIILGVALPALAFQAYAVSASAMPVFLGTWVLQGDFKTTSLWLGGAFAVLYTAIALVTYPFARRGGFPAAVAAVASAVLILGWIVYRVMFRH